MSFTVKVILVLLSIILLEFYFVKRVVNSVYYVFPRISKNKIRTTKWIALLIINIYPVLEIAERISRILTGERFFSLPETFLADVFVLYPFWIGTMIIIQSTLFFLLFEIVSLLIIPFVNEKQKRIEIRSTVFFIIFAIIAIYAPLRIIYDYYSVEVRDVIYTKEDLPEVLNGFKIGFISDIQADRYTNEKRLDNYIEKLNSANPDLVLMAGDIITSTPDFIGQSAKQLSQIKSKYGVFTCVGDHDNWVYRGDMIRSRSDITKALAEFNIPMIDNDKLILGIDSANIEVTFITNTYSERVTPEVLERLSKDNSQADLRIFLTHQPRENMIYKSVENGYDFYLCGHTHGGQITFIFPFLDLSPTLFETTYVRGDFWFGKTLMIVNRGLGMSLAPIRFNSTPEVTIITILK